jgi:hypothetical protein
MYAFRRKKSMASIAFVRFQPNFSLQQGETPVLMGVQTRSNGSWTMPYYFLHLRDDSQLIEDLEGQMFDDLAAAEREAIEGAREIMADSLRCGRALGIHREIVVSDDDGRTVSTVAFRTVLPD